MVKLWADKPRWFRISATITLIFVLFGVFISAYLYLVLGADSGTLAILSVLVVALVSVWISLYSMNKITDKVKSKTMSIILSSIIFIVIYYLLGALLKFEEIAFMGWGIIMFIINLISSIIIAVKGD